MLIVERRRALFDDDAIDRMTARFETLLAAALDRPDAPIETLAFVPPDAAAAAVLRGPRAEIPCLIARIARHAPHETALIAADGNETWTGVELDAAAERLARRLRARPELAGPDPRLGVCLPRGPQLVVAMLAALKAGIAYVPLDPTHPAARREAILRDAEAGLALAAGASGAPCPTLDPASLKEDAPEADLPEPDPDRIAYLIYTSGSTGRPKGVPISHGALSNLIASMAERPGMAPGDRLLALTTVAFDIAGLELLLPLAVGGVLVLADEGMAGAPDRLAAALDRHGVTHMQATPATWRLLIENGWTGRQGLTALCGGEALPSDLARELMERTAALWNMYGPTETTIFSVVHRVTPGRGRIPIGVPIANTEAYVLDEHDQLVPVGEFH